MNRQVRYIVFATGWLLLAAIITWFIEWIPAGKPAVYPVGIDQSVRAEPAWSAAAVKGKSLFQQKCASCHHPQKDMIGPALAGFTQRGPWTDRKNIYAWIRNPAAFMEKNDYTRGLKVKFNLVMQAFPDMADEEIGAIITYLEENAAVARPVAQQ